MDSSKVTMIQNLNLSLDCSFTPSACWKNLQATGASGKRSAPQCVSMRAHRISADGRWVFVLSIPVTAESKPSSLENHRGWSTQHSKNLLDRLTCRTNRSHAASRQRYRNIPPYYSQASQTTCALARRDKIPSSYFPLAGRDTRSRALSLDRDFR